MFLVSAGKQAGTERCQASGVLMPWENRDVTGVLSVSVSLEKTVQRFDGVSALVSEVSCFSLTFEAA